MLWFEPTDIRKASKPFSSDFWKSLHFISPNISELKVMAQAAGIPTFQDSKHYVGDDLLKEACFLALALAEHIAVVVITLGKLGLLIARRGDSNDLLVDDGGCLRGHSGHIKTPVSVRLYSVSKLRDVVSVSGAGDCLAAGFIAGALSCLSEEECVAVGVSAARLALQSSAAVPENLFNVRQWKHHSVPIRCSTLHPNN